MCTLGMHILDGAQTAGGLCGFVHVPGRQLPPPADKLLDADLPQGAVKIRATAAPWLKSTGKKWINLEKDDLARLAACPVPQLRRGRAVGPVIAGAYPMISAATDHNRFKALVCRMFRSPPPPRKGLWAWAASFKRAVWPLYDIPPAPMTDQEWLDSVPSNRKPALQKAMDLWQRSGWSQKYEKFNSFIKEEFLPFFDKDGLDLVPLREMVDRLINAPHDVTHCVAGPKIKPYMLWLKIQWSWDTHLFYGGTKPEYLQKWLARATSMGERLVFWSDYSMFDSSHNSQTWEFVEDFYRQHFSDPVFMRVLQAWRSPNGSLGNLKYQGRVMNASGRDDTALANALLNGIAMLLSVTAAWFRIPLEQVELKHIHLISCDLLLSVCGDDALGFLPPCTPDRALDFITRARGHLTEFGFKAKMFCSDRFEDAVYLGHRPIIVDGKWYWGKTLGRCLYKLGWQCKIRGDPAAHFRGICKMHAVCSVHVPILSDIATTWLQQRPKAKANVWVEDPNKPWEMMGQEAPRHYSADTIASVARAYTVDRRPCRTDLSVQDVLVTPRDVVDCITYVTEQVSKAKGTPCVLDHWLLRHMVAVDEQ